MFGLGLQEILLLAILGGGLVVAVLVVVFVSRGGSRVAQLEAENRRLRGELDRRDGRA